MNPSKVASHVSFSDGLKMGPPPNGNLAIPIFNYGTMEVELYVPSVTDPQKPHTRDEIYLVARGKSEFFDGEKTILIEAGSFIFVPAGIEHRFENFSKDFVAWVFFYGPEGGE